jgi:hypothetical protein
MKVYYRFSFNLMPDHTGKPRNPPQRPNWFDKWACLKNFTKVFKNQNITLVADGVDDNTWEKLNELYPFLDLHRTEFGSNAESFMYCLRDSITLSTDTYVYFVEDDYIHHEGSDLILEQGLAISKYVSLYDHPDKYWGENASKVCQLFMTEDCHWRTTGSTTMTFASSVNNLIEDYDLFKQWCGGTDRWTHDFQLFTEISKTKGLITPVPGYATHLDSWVIGKMVDWEDVLNRTTDDEQ